MNTTNSNLLALDSDSVMTDYNAVFPEVWEKAFGVRPKLVNEGCYHANRAYGMDLNDPEVKAKFYSVFDEHFWSSMPAMPGAQEACRILVEKGYRLECVTSMPQRFQQARVRNLKDLALPIDKVYACERQGDEANPKLETLLKLKPRAFVDDLLANFQGLPESIHAAWVDGRYVDDPNADLRGAGLHHGHYSSLLDFAQKIAPAR